MILRKTGRTVLASIAMGIIAYGAYYLTIPYLRNSASVILAIIAGIISYTMFVIMFNVITEEELKELPKGEKLLPIFVKAKNIRNKVLGIKVSK